MILFSELALAIEPPWDFHSDDRDACAAAALPEVENMDVLGNYRAKRASVYYAMVTTLNQQLPENRRFSPEQVDQLYRHFISADIHEIDQAEEIFEADMTDGRQIKPEYVDAVHEWLLTFVSRPVPSREEIEEFKRTRPRAPLNPIEKIWLADLEDAYTLLVARLRQPLYSNRDEMLTHYARSHSGVRYALKIWESIPTKNREYHLADYVDRVGKIRMHLRDYGGYPGGLGELDVVVGILDNPAYRAEIKYYTDAPDLFGFKFLEERARGWILGHETLIATVREFIASKVLLDWGIFITGGPHGGYIGDLYGFSLYAHMQRAKPWEGLNHGQLIELEKVVQRTPIEVKHLGQVRIDGGISEIFAVEMRKGDEVQHLAVQARASYAEGATMDLEQARPQDLKELKIVEIRPLTQPARIQDAFRTVPLDLAEPLLKLDPESAIGAGRRPPEYILVSRLAPNEREAGEQSEIEVARDMFGELGMILVGQDPMLKPYAEIRLFDGFTQRGDGVIRLPLISERTGQQVYQAQATSWFTRVTWLLRRNLISGRYDLTIARERGVFGIWVPVAMMTATYHEER